MYSIREKLKNSKKYRVLDNNIFYKEKNEKRGIEMFEK